MLLSDQTFLKWWLSPKIQIAVNAYTPFSIIPNTFFTLDQKPDVHLYFGLHCFYLFTTFLCCPFS